MFDCRLGKRRLTALEFRTDENALVKSFYHLRCQADGLEIPPSV